MHSAAICYSPGDAGSATELRAYLEINCPVTIEEGVVQMGADLLDAVETGLAFDYAIVLLSNASTHPAWTRARWESILFEQAKTLRTGIVYVLLEDCKFPAILRKETFFDLGHDFAGGRRSLKRWLLAQFTSPPAAPQLPQRSGNPVETEAFEPLADWPDFAQSTDREAVLAFAYMRHADFEAVVWIDCVRRGPVGVLGDVAHGVGLRLEGNWEDNAQALREHCAEHRLLLVFENPDTGIGDLVHFGGKASIVLLETEEVSPRRSLADLLRLFSAWKRNSHLCLAALGDLESYLDSPEILEEENWPQACTLCSAAVALLKDAGRLAEAFDLLARISSATQVRGDLAVHGQVEWETSWILDAWDQPVQVPGQMAAAISEPTQLSLFG